MSENIEVVVLGGGSTLAYDHLVHAVGSGASAPRRARGRGVVRTTGSRGCTTSATPRS